MDLIGKKKGNVGFEDGDEEPKDPRSLGADDCLRKSFLVEKQRTPRSLGADENDLNEENLGFFFCFNEQNICNKITIEQWDNFLERK